MIIYNEITYKHPDKYELELKPGYVYVRLLKNLQISLGDPHIALFFELFKEMPSKLKSKESINLITSGFMRNNLAWSFKSEVLNTGP